MHKLKKFSHKIFKPTIALDSYPMVHPNFWILLLLRIIWMALNKNKKRKSSNINFEESLLKIQFAFYPFFFHAILLLLTCQTIKPHQEKSGERDGLGYNVCPITWKMIAWRDEDLNIFTLFVNLEDKEFDFFQNYNVH